MFEGKGGRRGERGHSCFSCGFFAPFVFRQVQYSLQIHISFSLLAINFLLIKRKILELKGKHICWKRIKIITQDWMVLRIVSNFAFCSYFVQNCRSKKIKHCFKRLNHFAFFMNIFPLFLFHILCRMMHKQKTKHCFKRLTFLRS